MVSIRLPKEWFGNLNQQLNLDEEMRKHFCLFYRVALTPSMTLLRKILKASLNHLSTLKAGI